MREPYGWQKLYQAAVLETDGEKLRDLIHTAKAAIDSRLKEIQSHHGENPPAIGNSLLHLHRLRHNSLFAWFRAPACG